MEYSTSRLLRQRAWSR